MVFSDRLLDAMRSKKISYRELSEMTGIPKSAIQRYTSGETDKIPIDRVILMAQALNVDPAYIMGWDMTYVPKEGIELCPDEQELLTIYRDLNDKGQDALMRQARYLASDPDMKKGSASNIETA